MVALRTRPCHRVPHPLGSRPACPFHFQSGSACPFHFQSGSKRQRARHPIDGAATSLWPRLGGRRVGAPVASPSISAPGGVSHSPVPHLSSSNLRPYASTYSSNPHLLALQAPQASKSQGGVFFFNVVMSAPLLPRVPLFFLTVALRAASGFTPEPQEPGARYFTFDFHDGDPSCTSSSGDRQKFKVDSSSCISRFEPSGPYLVNDADTVTSSYTVDCDAVEVTFFDRCGGTVLQRHNGDDLATYLVGLLNALEAGQCYCPPDAECSGILSTSAGMRDHCTVLHHRVAARVHVVVQVAAKH